MAIERVDLICTGGLYDDPELGPTARHPRQKLGRVWIKRMGTLGQYGASEPVRKCPQCGRHTRIGMAGPKWADMTAPTPEEVDLYPTGYDGGRWQRVIDWANREFPDRLVFVADISDKRYSL